MKEVTEACDEVMEPIIQNEARLKRIREQMEMRQREREGIRPTMEQLQEKYGENWGLTSLNKTERAHDRSAPTWSKITEIYQSDPSMLARLTGERP